MRFLKHNGLSIGFGVLFLLALAGQAVAGYNEFNTLLQTELDENVFNAANKTAADAIATVNEQLNGILASGTP